MNKRWYSKILRRTRRERERLGDSRARSQHLEKRLIRRERALSLNLLERDLGSSQDLARALQQVVTLAYEVTGARSCEIALYSLDTGSYHSALLIGLPRHVSAQAMLGGAAGDAPVAEGHNSVVQPVIFAGETLGSLRISFEPDRIVSPDERDMIKLLAVQAGVAILNSRHSLELGRISRAAGESLQAKLGFLANLSHEIRAPLGIMMNGVELVLRGLCGDVNDDMEEVLGMVKTSGSHLLELVNDVLDYAKADAGLLEAQPEVVELSELLTDVHKIVRPLAEKKSHSLEFLLPKKSLCIEVDRRHLRQIAINLLTNAIKYTKDGGEVVVRADESNGLAAISVRDNGIGMKQEDLDVLFDPFKRANNQYAQSQQGTGLGMALTKQLVELNHGRIKVRSAPGEGTEVVIGFPLSDKKEDADESTSAHEIDGAGRRVLIVAFPDSAPDAIARYLASISFRVDSVTYESSEQLAALNTSGFAAIVICALHKVDGVDVSAVSRAIDESARESSTRTVLVVVGAQATKPELEPLVRAGVDRYIAHPASLPDIAQAIDQIHRSAAPTVIDSQPPSEADVLQ